MTDQNEQARETLDTLAEWINCYRDGLGDASNVLAHIRKMLGRPPSSQAAGSDAGAAEMLQSLEWSYFDATIGTWGCPVCHGLWPKTRFKREIGHKPDCSLAAALASSSTPDPASERETALRPTRDELVEAFDAAADTWDGQERYLNILADVALALLSPASPAQRPNPASHTDAPGAVAQGDGCKTSERLKRHDSGFNICWTQDNPDRPKVRMALVVESELAALEQRITSPTPVPAQGVVDLVPGLERAAEIADRHGEIVSNEYIGKACSKNIAWEIRAEAARLRAASPASGEAKTVAPHEIGMLLTPDGGLIPKNRPTEAATEKGGDPHNERANDIRRSPAADIAPADVAPPAASAVPSASTSARVQVTDEVVGKAFYVFKTCGEAFERDAMKAALEAAFAHATGTEGQS